MSTENDEISKLYQQGKDSQPPAFIDNAILSAAKKAVTESAQSSDQNNSVETATIKGPFSGGWPAMASIAAVLIITVILVPLINQEPTQTTSSETVNQQETLLERDYLDNELIEHADTIKAKQRTISKQKKNRDEARHLLQAPAMSSGKAQTIQDTPASALMESTLKQEGKYTRKKSLTVQKSVPAKNEDFNYLMSIPENKASTPARSPLEARDRITSQEFEADDKSPIILSPKAWLEKIQQLIDQNDIELAQKELEAFTIEYPDEVIEQSILERL